MTISKKLLTTGFKPTVTNVEDVFSIDTYQGHGQKAWPTSTYPDMRQNASATVNGVFLSEDGRTIVHGDYQTIRTRTFEKPFDFSSAVVSTSSVHLYNDDAIMASTGKINSVHVSEDGLNVACAYEQASGGAINVVHYALTTAFDLSTRSTEYNGNSGGTDNTFSYVMYNNDGTKVYWWDRGTTSLNQADVSTPYTIHSRNNTQSVNLGFAQTHIPFNFTDNGTKLWILGSNRWHGYDLATPYDAINGRTSFFQDVYNVHNYTLNFGYIRGREDGSYIPCNRAYFARSVIALFPPIAQHDNGTWVAGATTLTNGVDMSEDGGMVMVMNRSNQPTAILSTDHKRVQWYLNSTTRVFTTNALIHAGSEGATIGVETALSQSNGSDEAPANVAYTFKRTPGFFDMVTYVGDGNGLQTITHNLDAEPAFMIVTAHANGYPMPVYVRELGADRYVNLVSASDQTTSQYVWNNTHPTSSEFYVGLSNDTNASGVTYTAFMWASGDARFGAKKDQTICFAGTTGGGVINTGWETGMFWHKCFNNAATNWHMLDRMRGIDFGYSNSKARVKQTNTTNIETDATSTTGSSLLFDNEKFSIEAMSFSHVFLAVRAPTMRTAEDLIQPVRTISGVGTSNGLYAQSYRNNIGYGAQEGAWWHGFPADFAMMKLRNAKDTYGFYHSTRHNMNYNTLSFSASYSGNTLGATANFNMQNMEAAKLGFGLATDTAYTSWAWRKAKGFFGTAVWRGNGNTAERQIKHDLGVTPELIIWQGHNNNAAADSPWMWHAQMPYEEFLRLDSTGGAARHNWTTAPDANYIYFDTSGNESNGNNYTYTAHCFASVPGVAKVGTYEATGTATPFHVECGFSPRMVFIRRYHLNGGLPAASANTVLFDTLRGFGYSGSENQLFINTDDAEVVLDRIDANDTGFTIKTNDQDLNASNSSYMFYAVA